VGWDRFWSLGSPSPARPVCDSPRAATLRGVGPLLLVVHVAVCLVGSGDGREDFLRPF
jgi:hypothetical protein